MIGGQSSVALHYDERGHVASVGGSYGTLVANTKFDADALPLKYQYGDAAKTSSTFDYDGRRRLFHSKILRKPGWAQAVPAGDASTREPALQELTLTYDAVSNPTQITDNSDSDADYPTVWPDGAKPIHTKTIGYDDLYHVTSVTYDTAGDSFEQPFAPEFAAELAGTPSKTSSPVTAVARNKRITSQTFDYDALGNITASDDDSKTFYDRSLGTIGYDSAAPNRMVSAIHANGNLSVTYDVAGNVTGVGLHRSNTSCVVPRGCAGSSFNYEWDELGRLSHAARADISPPSQLVQHVAIDYKYDANGARVLKATSIDGQSPTYGAEIFPTLRLDGASWNDGHVQYQDDATTEGVYLVATAAPLARLAYADSDPRTGTSGSLHVFFELRDVLGSSSFVIDRDTGELVERTTYQPYGAIESDRRSPRWADFREVYKFTGAEEDVGVGVSYFGGRYYAPALGRFLSADPVTIHAQQGDLNPYAYVAGRVFRATDPTGLEMVMGGGFPIPGAAELGNFINEAVDAVQEMASGFEAGSIDGALSGAPSLVGAVDTPTTLAGAVGYAVGEVAGMAAGAVATDGLSIVAEVANVAHVADVVAVTADAVDTVETVEAVKAASTIEDAVHVGQAIEEGEPLMSAAAEAPIADLGESSASAISSEATSGTDIVETTATAADTLTADISEAHPTFQPGPYAGDSIPARSSSQTFTAQEREAVNSIMADTGCHTCGTKAPGTISGNAVPDHQPVSSLNFSNGPQRLYPQCLQCSFDQMQAAAEALRALGRSE